MELTVNLLTKIARSSQANENMADVPHPCPKCGSPGRWIDVYDQPHCEICTPCPSLSLRKRREILLWHGTDAATWEERSPKPPWCPFSNDPPPPGVWFPIGDPERQKQIQEPRTGECHCRSPSLANTPARGGEWTRVYCSRCGRTIRLIDAIDK